MPEGIVIVDINVDDELGWNARLYSEDSSVIRNAKDKCSRVAGFSTNYYTEYVQDTHYLVRRRVRYYDKKGDLIGSRNPRLVIFKDLALEVVDDLKEAKERCLSLVKSSAREYSLTYSMRVEDSTLEETTEVEEVRR